MAKLVRFTRSQVKELLEKRKSSKLVRALAVEIKEYGLPPDRIIKGGWRISVLSPVALVAIFEPIMTLKEGRMLIGYQQYDEHSGRGAVYAMPIDAKVPEPESCMVPIVELSGLLTPKPPGALKHVMEAVDHLGPKDEYVCLLASVLYRELLEFGAFWHGSYWGEMAILTSAPYEGKLAHRTTPSPKEEWKMSEPKPPFVLPEIKGKLFWGPHALIEDGKVTIVLNLFTAHDQQRVLQVRDTYREASGLVPETETGIIAIGGQGFMR